MGRRFLPQTTTTTAPKMAVGSNTVRRDMFSTGLSHSPTACFGRLLGSMAIIKGPASCCFCCSCPDASDARLYLPMGIGVAAHAPGSILVAPCRSRRVEACLLIEGVTRNATRPQLEPAQGTDPWISASKRDGPDLGGTRQDFPAIRGRERKNSTLVRNRSTSGLLVLV